MSFPPFNPHYAGDNALTVFDYARRYPGEIDDAGLAKLGKRYGLTPNQTRWIIDGYAIIAKFNPGGTFKVWVPEHVVAVWGQDYVDTMWTYLLKER